MKTKLAFKGKSRPYLAAVLVLFGAAVLLLLMIISITQGAAKIPYSMVVNAFLDFDRENPRHLLVIDMRLPRVLAAALVGSALAVSGALMQGMTRNPLADSGLMGLSSGAGLALAVCVAYLTKVGYSQIIVITFFGAAFGAGAVYIISSLIPGGNSPLKLVLAGATVSTLFSALSQGIAIMTKVSRNVFFWTMGNVSGTDWKQIMAVMPVILLALAGAVALSRSITLLSMGDEVASGLGLRTGLVKAMGTVLVVLLAGTSVALAGMISFVGIVIPHITRFLVGADYRLIIPVSAILGAVLLVAADLGAKTLAAPTELPIGALIAVLGVPVFLYFARRQHGS